MTSNIRVLESIVANQGRVVYEPGLTCFIELLCSNMIIEVSEVLRELSDNKIVVKNICLFSPVGGASSLVIYVEPNSLLTYETTEIEKKCAEVE